MLQKNMPMLTQKQVMTTTTTVPKLAMVNLVMMKTMAANLVMMKIMPTLRESTDMTGMGTATDLTASFLNSIATSELFSVSTTV